MSTEAEIRNTIEEYLKLEAGLKYHFEEKEVFQHRYQKLLAENPPENNLMSVQKAALIIHAQEQAKEHEEKLLEESHRLNQLSNKIEEWIKALNGARLHVRFEYDSLDHRAGDHIFYLENGQLKSTHSPVS